MHITKKVPKITFTWITKWRAVSNEHSYVLVPVDLQSEKDICITENPLST